MLTFQPNAMYGGVHPLMTGPIGDPFGYSPNLQSGFVPGPPGASRQGVMATTPVHGSGSVLPPGPMGGAAAAGITEVTHIWVPNHIVGALIGTKGTQIRNVIRLTGASIRIESSKSENEGGNASDHGSPPPQGHPGRRDTESERRVTISGIDQQQYRVRFTFLTSRLINLMNSFLGAVLGIPTHL